MARPHKQRKICSPPRYRNFGPLCKQGNENITLTLDEYESLRLIDYEGLTQQECAREMGVARTTVQAIYTLARKKLATFIVKGNQLTIEGGEVVFCDHQHSPCGKKCCHEKSEARKIKGNLA